MLKDVSRRLKTKGIESLRATESFMNLLPEDAMAEKMLAGEIKEGDSVIVDADEDGKVVILNSKNETPVPTP
ncbi:Chaperone protein ClpC, chloroplastic-like protein [Drosera capensis]